MPLPTVEDLKDYLIAAGLYSDPPSAIQSRLDLEGANNAAIEKWQNITHYWPFMSDGNVNETRYFDPPNSRLLDLNSGLLQLVSLTTDLQYDATANNSLSTGTTRQNLRDFRLKPTDAPPRNKPWTYIEMGWWPCGVAGSIAVTGEWGYCTTATIPAAAKRGMLSIAAGMLMPQITLQVSRGGLKMLQRGDEEKQWDMATLGKVFATDLKSVLTMHPEYIRPRVSF